MPIIYEIHSGGLDQVFIKIREVRATSSCQDPNLDININTLKLGTGLGFPQVIGLEQRLGLW